jgi:diguanylate cyclase (GGDEF)-like protein
MRPFHGGRRWIGHLTLTRQVALLSLVPIVALGLILARVLQGQIVERSLADADQSAQLIARIGIQPRLTPHDLRYGMSAGGMRALDEQLRTRSVTQDLARIKIWNAHDTVIYSDDHSLIGRTLPPSDDLLDALAGKPHPAALVTPSEDSETASEVGLGELVEVYVPLRFYRSTQPTGVFEIYLSYKPIAAAVARDKRMIAALIAVGLALLWAILYRIVARASRRLREHAEENARLARYDQLTGLPNRTLFIESVEHAVSANKQGAGAVAVLLIDLDRFTEINNTLGSANGDLVLCEVAERLRATLGEGVVVARLAGDGFAVLLCGAQGVPDALGAATDIQRSLEPSIALDEIEVAVEASVGVAVIGEHAKTPAELLQRADAALAHARSRRSSVEIYAPECDHFDAERLRLLSQVRGALGRGELILHYQPQIELQTGAVTGVEALVRWHHPAHGLLAPAKFIPLIEQTALVGPLTLHLIDQALDQLLAWGKLGITPRMSVNLSARNLLDPALPRQIAELLDRHKVAPEKLVVEVTESAAMIDPQRSVAVLAALRATGVGVSVDDFGTGNASIEYLAMLPASEIKIDRSFITGILEEPRSEAIVRSIIDLARNLGLTVVAEGIETEAVQEALTALGCQTGQGYFISRPQPADVLTASLRSNGATTPAPSGPDGATSNLISV